MLREPGDIDKRNYEIASLTGIYPFAIRHLDLAYEKVSILWGSEVVIRSIACGEWRRPAAVLGS